MVFLLQMNSKIELFSVFLPTNVTFMHLPLVSLMQLEVLGQISVLSKLLASNLAEEGFFSSMDPHVVEEVPGLFENLSTVTVLAAKHSPIAVRTLILGEIDLKVPVEPIEVFRDEQSSLR